MMKTIIKGQNQTPLGKIRSKNKFFNKSEEKIKMYKSYKINVLSLILLVLLASCTIYVPSEDLVDNTRFSVNEDFSFDIVPDTQTRIIVLGINGSIHISGTSGNQVRIWGKRIVESESYNDADEHLDHLRVEVERDEDDILVKTIQPSNSGGRNYKVTYYVEVPYDWDVEVELINGPVDIDSIDGDIWADQVNGNIDLNNTAGNVSVESTNGNIYGDLSIPHHGYCEMRLVNGNIYLMIPRGLDADVAASVVNGFVTVENLTFQYITQSRESVSGIIGNGGTDIELSAVNGNITLRGN